MKFHLRNLPVMHALSHSICIIASHTKTVKYANRNKRTNDKVTSCALLTESILSVGFILPVYLAIKDTVAIVIILKTRINICSIFVLPSSLEGWVKTSVTAHSEWPIRNLKLSCIIGENSHRLLIFRVKFLHWNNSIFLKKRI